MAYKIAPGADDKGREKSRSYVVYVIRNSKNNLCYVGITCQTLTKRWVHHKSSAKRRYRAGPLQVAMNQLGESCFRIEALEHCSSKAEMVLRELFWITALNTMAPNGLNANLFAGYPGNWKHSDEAKAKIRAAKTGQHPTDATRLKLAAWQKGATLSAAHRANISKALTGRKHSEEAKNNIRLSKLGKKRGPNKVKTINPICH